MECKEHTDNYRLGFEFHWNISRMECKDNVDTLQVLSYPYWNISRMECKEYIVKIIASKNYLIGIYPEWNVKQGCLFAVRLSTLLEYIQNGM